MLKKLEEKRKLFAAIFFLLSVIFITPIIFFVTDSFYKVAIIGILVIHFVLSLFYYFKGIAKAIKWAVYYIVFLITVVILGFLSANITLPKYLDSNIFCSIGVIIYVFVLQFLRLPVKSERFIENKIEGYEIYYGDNLVDNKLQVHEEEIDAYNLFIPTKRRKSITYELMYEYKGMMKYSSKSYSLVNCSSKLKIFRTIISFLLIGFGVIALLIGTNANDEVISLFSYWAFWLVISGFTSLFMGCAILLFGFLRAIFVPVIVAILFGVVLLSYEILNKANQESFLYAIMIIILLSVSIIGALYKIIKKVNVNIRNDFEIYNRNEIVRGIDLIINDIIPIKGYTYFVKADIHIESEISLNKIDSFNSSLIHFCGMKKFIFCGFELYKNCYTIYLYLKNDTKNKNKLIKYLNSKVKDFSLNIEKDSKWLNYREIIYPTIYEVNEIYNKNIYNSLNDNGFDFTETETLTFKFLFVNIDKAKKFADYIEQYGFKKTFIEDNTENVDNFELQDKYSFIVYAQLKSKVGLERMNINTKNAIDIAVLFEGEFDEWVFGDIDEVTFEEDSIDYLT